MHIKNIFIIAAAVIITGCAITFFLFAPRKNAPAHPETDQQTIIDDEPEQKARPIQIQRMESTPMERDPLISAADYSNFEKSIDKLITLTEE